VVEDDLELATLETDILIANGYSATSVPSGELAITLFRHIIPDLIVLDLELTGSLHGFDVLHNLRALHTHTSVPVLLTSSSVTVARTYVRESRETRATLDHLAKPYAIQTFLKRIQRMLSINPSQ
jgi:DNA-binding response OmpR family regulator